MQQDNFLLHFFCLYAMTACGINKLTALQVKKVSPDKMYKLTDGGNLYLRIDSSGTNIGYLTILVLILVNATIYH